jgi:hypothetical protein
MLIKRFMFNCLLKQRVRFTERVFRGTQHGKYVSEEK